MKQEEHKGEIVIFKSKAGVSALQVRLEADTVWLSQKMMSELFQKDTDTIGLHLGNVYKERELHEKSTTEYFSVVQKEGKRTVTRRVKYYNLDAIISVGYKRKLEARYAVQNMGNARTTRTSHKGIYG